MPAGAVRGSVRVFLFQQPLLFALDAGLHDAVGLDDELYPAIAVRLLADEVVRTGRWGREDNLFGMLAQAVVQASALLAVGIVLAGAFLDEVEFFQGQRAAAAAAGADEVDGFCFHRLKCFK